MMLDLAQKLRASCLKWGQLSALSSRALLCLSYLLLEADSIGDSGSNVDFSRDSAERSYVTNPCSKQLNHP
jgi:hypothetical protein